MKRRNGRGKFIEMRIMKEKYINLILSNVSQRSHCLVLKIFFATQCIYEHRTNLSFAWNHGEFSSYLHFVNRLHVSKQTISLFLAALLCVCVCASSVEMRCLCTKIYLGRKWCTKGDLCKFFIVLWYTEIFLNAYLNDLYTFANAMMKRDGKRKGPRVQNMHKCADWCCCFGHCYIVVYSNVLSITNMFWAQFFSICLPRLSPPSSVWCYFVMFHTVNKWQLTRYI